MGNKKNGTGHDKHQYVVGYHDDLRCVYGRDEQKRTMYCDPMTLRSAERYLGRLQSSSSKAIYKLVPIKVIHP